MINNMNQGWVGDQAPYTYPFSSPSYPPTTWPATVGPPNYDASLTFAVNRLAAALEEFNKNK